jgi:hypothetical protein
MKHCGILLLYALTVSGAACAAEKATVAGAEDTGAASVSLEVLVGNPEGYVGKAVQVTGTLENAGSNYFTDLRVQLRDDQGHAIAVQPWLPTALPPGPKRPGVTPPPTLSTYMGKRVDLTAVVEHGELPRRDEVFYLKVQSATVVK